MGKFEPLNNIPFLEGRDLDLTLTHFKVTVKVTHIGSKSATFHVIF